ncbi:MAG TPA: hypothetical protein VMS37_13460 [Verrucomicrobiae bacterium]|nr:hypothetical protein [Verrucomicrobiae bacterium]
MRKTLRRRFLKQAGQAAAGGCLAGRLTAASTRMAIIADAADKMSSAGPVRWAIGELRRAVEVKGATCAVVTSAAQAEDFQAAVIIGRQEKDLPNEAFRLVPGKQDEKTAVRASASDARGLVYAITELADRVQHGADPAASLRLAVPIQEKPANTVRSIARAFVSDVEDKSWFYDRDYWRDYLSALVTNRFNRFSLAFGWGYDFPRDVVGDYFHFPYPYLLDVPGYKVRAVPLDDGERERNLETLRFIVEQTTARGLDFQLALWTHAYQWTDSPHAQHRIEGLTPETHAQYCRDALALLLKTCPGIQGITLRVHGESGIPEGSYDFWRTVFQGIVRAGRRIEIDMHAKGIDQKMIDVAMETGMPVKISPKYWAEHQGMGYHQAAIRELEMPREGERVEGIFSLSNGSRRFLRYGYGDLFQQGRRYGVLFRMWAGTQRMLLWGDPATAAAYGHASHFCGASGVELCEPLFFKGRQGTGRPGGRCGYIDASLNPSGGDWRKYEYSYRVWGRLLYNPDADPDQWRRYLRSTFERGAAPAETALANASRVLPLLTTAHQPSASNLGYWVEVPVNMPIMEGGAPVPYGDTPAPKRFGTVSPLDPEMFSFVEEHAVELLGDNPSGKYSPIEIAQFFEDSCGKAAKALEAAAAAVPSRRDPVFRRWEEDVLIQVALGRFYADKLRAGVLFDLYRRTGNESAHLRAVTTYRRARATWATMAERARGVYVSDLTYGDAPVRRGHWLDRLPAIDQDLAAVERARFNSIPELQDRLNEAMERASGRPSRPPFPCSHKPVVSYQPGKPVTVTVRVSGTPTAVTLRYRRVNQAERWQSIVMQPDGQVYRAAIPASYTESPFALQYYFHLRQASGAALYPGFNEMFANQPYFLVARG